MSAAKKTLLSVRRVINLNKILFDSFQTVTVQNEYKDEYEGSCESTSFDSGSCES